MPLPRPTTEAPTRVAAKPLTVVVTAVSAVLGGGITVARMLTSAIAKQAPHHRLGLYCAHEDVARHPYPDNVEVEFLPALARRGARWRWEQFALPAIAARRRADVILALGGYLSFLARTPQVAVWQNQKVFSPPALPRPLSELVWRSSQRFAQSASLRIAAQNVFLSKTSLDLASQLWPMDRLRHCVIHSGVDVDRLTTPNPKPLAERDHLVLAVGHTYTHKNYEAIVDAIDHYRSRYDPPLRLRIIGGPVNPRYFSALEQRIADRKLSDLIEMAGDASHAEVLEAMSRARVYLVASLLETFSLTVLEAMGQGLPVIASDATCHPEVCGDAALLCDPHDPARIAEQLHQLISDDALAANLRERGFARVREFRWELAAQRYVEELERAARPA